jgi:hypothetical protein
MSRRLATLTTFGNLRSYFPGSQGHYGVLHPGSNASPQHERPLRQDQAPALHMPQRVVQDTSSAGGNSLIASEHLEPRSIIPQIQTGSLDLANPGIWSSRNDLRESRTNYMQAILLSVWGQSVKR